MCGRAATPAQDEAAGAAGPAARWVDADQYRQSYNAAPGAFVPVLAERQLRRGGAAPSLAEEQRSAEEQARRGGAADGPSSDAADDAPQTPSRVLRPMRWGLVTPSQTEQPDYFRMHCARNETVCEKPVFARLLPAKRCVVLLSGFYEWRTEGSQSNTVKQPYFVTAADGDLLRCAALYDCATCADGQPLYSVTLITRDAVPATRWLHDRTPLLLSRADAEAWLSPNEASPSRLLQRLCTTETLDVTLRWHPVTTQLNKIGNHLEVRVRRRQGCCSPGSVPSRARSA